MIRRRKIVISFISTDSFVVLQSFSFLKAHASEDGEEDNVIEGVVGERAFTRSRRHRMEEQSQAESRVRDGRKRTEKSFVRSFVKISENERAKKETTISSPCAACYFITVSGTD